MTNITKSTFGRSFIFSPSLVHPWFVLGLLPEEDRDGTRDEILNILHLYRFLLLFQYFKEHFFFSSVRSISGGEAAVVGYWLLVIGRSFGAIASSPYRSMLRIFILSPRGRVFQLIVNIFCGGAAYLGERLEVRG